MLADSVLCVYGDRAARWLRNTSLPYGTVNRGRTYESTVAVIQHDGMGMEVITAEKVVGLLHSGQGRLCRRCP
jgi:hypothetical protein